MKVKEKLEYLLKAHSDGLTISQLTERTGKSYAHVYLVMQKNKGFYIADWVRQNDKGHCKMIWKWSDYPARNMPKPASKLVTGERAQYNREYTAQWHKRRAIQTTIRGPWPAY